MTGYDPDSSAGNVVNTWVELKPPPVATLFAGQFACELPYGLFPPDVPGLTSTVGPVTTEYPLTPAGPVGPVGPAGPVAPVAPVGPMSEFPALQEPVES